MLQPRLENTREGVCSLWWLSQTPQPRKQLPNAQAAVEKVNSRQKEMRDEAPQREEVSGTNTRQRPTVLPASFMGHEHQGLASRSATARRAPE